MNYTIDEFFREISSHQYDILSLDLQRNGQKVSALQKQLLNNNSYSNDKTLDELVESKNFFDNKWTRFNILIVSFLKYCRDVNPWSSWDSCDIVFQFYSDLNNCLLSDSYSVDELVEQFLQATEFIIPLARTLDDNYISQRTKKHQFLSYISSIISKLFNSIKPNKGSDNFSGSFQDLPGKQQILLYLVNKLNNIYFRIESPQLCSNIFKNFKPKSVVDNFSDYPVQEQIEYRFLLGKYYLLNTRITNSFVQLNNAFNLLLALTNFVDINQTPQLGRNLKRVLKYLVPVGIMMDKVPKFTIIQSFDQNLALTYRELVFYIRQGNLFKVNSWLRSNESELLSTSLFITLIEKLPMICYKYLVKQLIHEWSLAQNSNRLPYDVVERGLRISLASDDYVNYENKQIKLNVYNGIHSSSNSENVLITLINIGYLRGNCFPLLKLCVFKKTNNVQDILPSIEERIINMFPLNNEDSWLDE